MAKDPAVLFYTSDFLSGTFTMTNEQVGMYIRLLCFQHQKGKLSEKDMLSICPTRDEDIWGKFDLVDGFYVNNRMYEEAEKRKNFIEKQKVRSNKRWKKDDAMAIPRDMPRKSLFENENVNENTLEIKEGGMGGDWQTEKGYFMNSDQWKYKFCTSKQISKDALESYMTEFVNDMELRNEFKDSKELQRHFTNWFNLKSKNAKQSTSVKGGRNTGAYELLDQLKRENGIN